MAKTTRESARRPRANHLGPWAWPPCSLTPLAIGWQPESSPCSRWVPRRESINRAVVIKCSSPALRLCVFCTWGAAPPLFPPRPLPVAPRPALLATARAVLARHPDVLNRWNALQVGVTHVCLCVCVCALCAWPLCAPPPPTCRSSLRCPLFLTHMPVLFFCAGACSRCSRAIFFFATGSHASFACWPTKVAIGVLLNERGVAMEQWAGRFRVPYW